MINRGSPTISLLHMDRFDTLIFRELAQRAPQSYVDALFGTEETDLDRQSPLQSPLAVKNLSMARQLAAYILMDNGEIDSAKVVACIESLSRQLYPLGPYRHQETQGREHMLHMLNTLRHNDDIRSRLKKVFLPSYQGVLQLIRSTLALPPTVSLTPAHARQAILTALFTYLRQDVGSCFASTVAILIHREYPLLFIRDLEELLFSGKLTRVIGDREIVVPINLSSSLGELFKQFRILDLYPNPVELLSSSLGLQNAFLAAHLISPFESPQQRIQELLAQECWLKPFQQFDTTITAHDIIQKTLLHHFQVSHDLVRSVLLQGGLHKDQAVLTTGHNQPSEIQRVYLYLEAYELAKAAFVSTTQNPLLKSWEYTLATLADASHSSTADHIRIALGWHREPHSFSSTVHRFVEETISQAQEETQKCERTYQEAQVQLQYVESRMRNPINEQDSKILAMDHIRFRQELNQALYDWDQAQEKIRKLLSLPDFVSSFYTKMISSYFKSSYDAFIQEFSHLYADSPAGFRVLFTHGRSHPNTWTPIYSIEEFVRALSDFFALTEVDLLNKHGVAGVEKETSALIHQLISLLHKESFQEAAIERILEAYHQPIPKQVLQHLNTLTHTPWVYVSGGDVSSLITDYFEHVEPITQLKKHPENAHELAAFFADALKDLPEGIKSYLEHGEHTLIASSPTHVFTVTAGSPLFVDAWNNDWYSYTWLRDVWIRQQQDFIHNTILSQQMVYLMIECFCNAFSLQKLARDFRDFCSDHSLSLPEFYDKASRFLKEVYPNPQRHNLLLRRLAQQIVRDVPYHSEQQMPEILEKISTNLGIPSRISYASCKALLDVHIPKYALLSTEELLHLYKGLLMHSYQSMYSDEDMSLRLITAMRSHGLAYPAPLLFGDTNWAYSYFGFLVHPGTQEVDLWQFSHAGLNGQPLVNNDVSLSVKHPWVLYANPIEYGMPPPPGYRSHMPKGFF